MCIYIYIYVHIKSTTKVEEIATLRFSLTEGKYRQIRRMFEYIGRLLQNTDNTKHKQISTLYISTSKHIESGESGFLHLRGSKGVTRKGV